MSRKPEPLDHLADALAEDILAAPAERMLAEAAEDHGDRAALAAAFDRVAARADPGFTRDRHFLMRKSAKADLRARQARPRRLADRIGALSALSALLAIVAPRGSWRPAMAAVAGLAVVVVAGDLYWHVRPDRDVPMAAAPGTTAQSSVAPDAVATRSEPVPAQAGRADAAVRPAQPPAAKPAAMPPTPEPRATAAAPPPPAAPTPMDQPRRVKTVAIGGAAAPINVAEAPLVVRPAVRDDRLRGLLDDARARTYDRVANFASPSSAQVAATTAPAPRSSAAPAGAPSFDWPLRGRVLARAPNEGIDVAVPIGTDVHAAADGVVIYAGGADKGFGNLLLVSHRDGFVTVYGYMSLMLVKATDEVRRGQVIAKSGASGEASEPQLHFEIRKGAAPVDPARLLPPG